MKQRISPDEGVYGYIYVDIDISYEDVFSTKTHAAIRRKIPEVADLIRPEIKRVAVRPSSSGNAHYMLVLDGLASVTECLCVRAYLHDDRSRLILDLVRWLKTGDPHRVNRLWSGKYKAVNYQAELQKCGEWVDIWRNPDYPDLPDLNL